MTRLEFELDLQLKEQNLVFTQDMFVQIGRMARELYSSPSYEEKIEGKDVLDDEVVEGLVISQEYPGGIYLAALVATGKVAAIDSIPISRLSDEKLAHYILIARDANAITVTALIEALQESEHDFETIYVHDEWTKVYTEGRRWRYPLYAFYLIEKERLSQSPEQIWHDESLPSKVKRQLLLQRLGIEINSHVHVPSEVFFKDGPEIISELHDLWKAPVGISSALYNEPILGRTPATRFSFEMDELEISKELHTYRQRLDNLDTIELEERDQVILYPYVWEDRDFIVGGAFRFDTQLQLAGERDKEIWTIEMQKGCWHRDINSDSEGYVALEYRPVIETSPGFYKDTSSRRVHKISPNVSKHDTVLAAAEIEAKNLAQRSLKFRRAISELMRITQKQPIAVEWVYHLLSGKIVAIDF